MNNIISFFNSLFNRNENVRYKLLKKSLLKMVKIKEVSKIIFLFAFKYDDENYKLFKESVNDRTILSFSKKNKLKIDNDALEIFFIEKINGAYLICLFVNPVEFLESEYVFELIDYNEIDISNFDEAEVIYVDNNITT
jgi:hypothetical protein